MAAAWVVAMPLLVLVSSTLSLPVIGLRWTRLCQAVLPPVAAALAMGLVVTGFDQLLPAMSPATRLATTVPVGIVAYAGFALLFARDTVNHAIAMLRGRGKAATA
jgi:hypothetical protein